MDLRIIQHNSEEYKVMIELRMKILRTPLGLSFTDEQLESEKKDILICAYDNEQLKGCCVLTKKDEKTIQLRQMAVDTVLQSKGIGKAIMIFAEEVARTNGYNTLMMHAREEAVGFYEKCGYKKEGEPFIEVTIPHYHMERSL